MHRREFFWKTFQATAAGILVPEHLLKGRSMVSLCEPFWYGDLVGRITATEIEIIAQEAIRRVKMPFVYGGPFYGVSLEESIQEIYREENLRRSREFDSLRRAFGLTNRRIR